MKSATMLAGLIALAGMSTTLAQQITIGVRTPGDSFLLYESIQVEVGIRNNTSASIELKATDGRPWLRFLVTDARGQALQSLAAGDTQSALVGARQTISRPVDLLPLYDLREPGQYTVQAILEAEGIRATAPPIKISIFQARDIWSQTVGLTPPPGGKTQFRTYALLDKRERDRDVLYARVSDERNGVVFGVLALGRYVALGEPSAEVDKASRLHVLWRLSPRQFGYVEIDPFAEITDRAIYNDLNSVPRLVQNPDGVVTVQGGTKTHPQAERVLTKDELEQPLDKVPPAKPAPKKKWWQFWIASPKPAKTATP